MWEVTGLQLRCLTSALERLLALQHGLQKQWKLQQQRFLRLLAGAVIWLPQSLVPVRRLGNTEIHLVYVNTSVTESGNVPAVSGNYTPKPDRDPCCSAASGRELNFRRSCMLVERPAGRQTAAKRRRTRGLSLVPAPFRADGLFARSRLTLRHLLCWPAPPLLLSGRGAAGTGSCCRTTPPPAICLLGHPLSTLYMRHTPLKAF